MIQLTKRNRSFNRSFNDDMILTTQWVNDMKTMIWKTTQGSAIRFKVQWWCDFMLKVSMGFNQSKFYSWFYNTACKRQGKGSRWRTACSSKAYNYHFELSYAIGGSTCWGSTKYRLAYIPCYSTLIQKLQRIYNNLVSPWLWLAEVGICLINPLFVGNWVYDPLWSLRGRLYSLADDSGGPILRSWLICPPNL